MQQIEYSASILLNIIKKSDREEINIVYCT